MHNPLSRLVESIKWEKGVIIWLHRKGVGLKRPAPLFLKCRAKCWTIICRISYFLIYKNKSESKYLLYNYINVCIYKVFASCLVYYNGKSLLWAAFNPFKNHIYSVHIPYPYFIHLDQSWIGLNKLGANKSILLEWSFFLYSFLSSSKKDKNI